MDGTKTWGVLRKLASGGAVCRVEFTWYVSGVKFAAGLFSEDVKAAKSKVDVSVA